MSRQLSGRSAVLADFQTSSQSFDRQFNTRNVVFIAPPEERPDGVVWAQWQATYHKNGGPEDLVVEGEEIAIFEGDKIKCLEDKISLAICQRVLNYFAQNGVHFNQA